jgi:hypothetical protein
MGVPSISDQKLVGDNRETVEGLSDPPITKLKMVNHERPQVEPKVNPPIRAFGAWAAQVGGIHNSNPQIALVRATPLRSFCDLLQNKMPQPRPTSPKSFQQSYIGDTHNSCRLRPEGCFPEGMVEKGMN